MNTDKLIKEINNTRTSVLLSLENLQRMLEENDKWASSSLVETARVIVGLDLKKALERLTVVIILLLTIPTMAGAQTYSAIRDPQPVVVTVTDHVTYTMEGERLHGAIAREREISIEGRHAMMGKFRMTIMSIQGSHILLSDGKYMHDFKLIDNGKSDILRGLRILAEGDQGL